MATATAGSADFRLYLGRHGSEPNSGFLWLYAETPSSGWSTPDKLKLAFNRSGVTMIAGGGSFGMQVKAPDGLVRVVVQDANTYNLECFHDQDVTYDGTRYQPVTGKSPFVVWTLHNPNGDINQLQITGPSQYDFTYYPAENKWSLAEGGGARIVSVSKASDQAGLIHEERRIGAGGQTVSVTTRTYKMIQDRQVLVRLVEGEGTDSRVTVYTRYESGNGVGEIKRVDYPDGRWEMFDYDEQGRMLHRYESYLSMEPPGVNAEPDPYTCKLTTYSYAPVGDFDDGSFRFRLARKEVVTVPEERDGKLVLTEISRRYRSAPSFDIVEERLCITNTGSCSSDDYCMWGDSRNLKTRQVYYDNASGANSGRLKSTSHADGTATIYQYIADTTTGRTLTIEQTGEPDSWSAPSSIIKGTQTTTVRDIPGRLVSISTEAIQPGSNPVLVEQKSYNYLPDDPSGRNHEVVDLAGRKRVYTYICCGLGTTTDADGSTTTYNYDQLKRLQTVTRSHPDGDTLTMVYDYDAAGKLVKTTRQGTGSSAPIILSAVAYNTAGQKAFETNAMKVVTAYTNAFNAITGETTKTNIYALGKPEQSTRIETYYRDGSLKSITGTAVHGVTNEYGVNALGRYRKETKLTDGSSVPTSEWTISYSDLAGRIYRTVYAPRPGKDDPNNPPDIHVFYNSKGQKTKVQDPDGVATLYQYNSEGQLIYTAIDLNPGDTQVDADGNYRINFALDRITETVRETGTKTDPHDARTYNVQRTVTKVWTENGTVEASSTETALNTANRDPLPYAVSWRTSYGLTTKTRVDYLGNGEQRETVTNPDHSTTVNQYKYGYLVSSAGPAKSATYQYDSNGRQWQTIDANNGATTYSYNDADEITSVTTPAPGPGLSAQTTTTTYDNLRRVARVAQPDGTVVTNEYCLTGELKKSYGSRTYPVQYTYDYAGRVTTMTNWTNFSTSAGARTTSWNYNPYRGWLDNKRYPDKDTGNPSTLGTDYTYTKGGRLQTRTWARLGTGGRPFATKYTYGFDDLVTDNQHGDLVGVDYQNDPEGTPAVTYTYDRRGRQVEVKQDSTEYPELSSTESLTYNDAGQPLTESYTKGALQGITVTIGYDDYLRRNWLSVNTQPSVVDISYGYNNVSRLETVTDNSGATPYSATYTYVDNSPLVRQILFQRHDATPPSPVMTTTKSYDHVNRLKAIATTASGAPVVSYDYTSNDANQRVRVTLSDGSYWVYEYDVLGQVKAGRKYWSDGSPVAGQQFEYAHDDIGNRSQTKAGGDENGGNLRQASYSVNALNQYTSRDVPGAVDVVGVALATSSVWVTSPGALNNGTAPIRKGEYFRKQLSLGNSGGALWEPVTVTAAGETPQIRNAFIPKTREQFAYDPDGSLTNDGRWAYFWDAENRLVRMVANTNIGPQQKITFQYDWKGRRIGKKVWSNIDGTGDPDVSLKFVYDGWNLIAEIDARNAQSPTLLRKYVWGLDLSGSLEGAGGVGGLLEVTYYGSQTTNCFAACDGNGNVAALVNAIDGNVSARCEYGPFGEVIRATGSMAKVNPFWFSTKYQDNETDLLYYGYRYYNASTGRWINRDPLRERGGNNLYGFVASDPINRIDILGLSWWPIKVTGDGFDKTVTDSTFLGSYTLIIKAQVSDSSVVVSATAFKYTFLLGTETTPTTSLTVTFACDENGYISANAHQQMLNAKGSVSAAVLLEVDNADGTSRQATAKYDAAASYNGSISIGVGSISIAPTSAGISLGNSGVWKCVCGK